MAFTVNKLEVLAGWSIQALSTNELWHEQDKELKNSFVAYMPTVIPSYDKIAWADFPVSMTSFFYYPETGSAEDSWVKDYLKGVLQASGVSGSIVIGPLMDPGCDNSPDGWERSRTYTVTVGGSKLTMAPAAEDYSTKVLIATKDKEALGALDILFTVRWTSDEP